MAGYDIIPDGKPVEEPEAAAQPGYAAIPPTLGQYLSEQVGTTIAQIGRVAQQGMYQGADFPTRALYSAFAMPGMAEAEGTAAPPPAGTVPTPMLAPAEYNDRYAPTGNDGKPVSLGTQPMSEGVAKLVGEARRQEIERENVTARFENAHSWPTNFAAGMAGFMLDPIRASTAFIPGVGEEAITATLGTSIAGRLGTRLLTGAAAGALAQAPISALQYGLGLEEASDYRLRDALRDVMFGAAGNAVFHAGIGTAGDILRARAGETAAPSPEALAAAPIIEADAQTQHAAMASAVAELADGRPVDVEPIVRLRTPEPIEGFKFLEPYLPNATSRRPPPGSPADLALQQRELFSDGFAPGVPPDDLKQATADVYAPQEPPEIATAPPGGPPATPAVPETAPTPPETPGARPAGLFAPKPEEQAELFAAHERLQQIEGGLSPEERTEIDTARAGLDDAERKMPSIEEAAACLKEAGA